MHSPTRMAAPGIGRKENDVIREPHKTCYGTMLPVRVEGPQRPSYLGQLT